MNRLITLFIDLFEKMMHVSTHSCTSKAGHWTRPAEEGPGMRGGWRGGAQLKAESDRSINH